MKLTFRSSILLVLLLCSAFASVALAQIGTAWVKRYSNPAVVNGSDQAKALAVDNSGNVYVTGFSQGSGTGYDYATFKYAANGDSLWVRRYNGPGNGDDFATKLEVDDSGNVYVTGYGKGSGTSDDYATIKYAPNGDTLWVRRYNGPGNYNDEALDLAVDDSAHVYVTGWSWNGTSYDYTTIKYSPSGDTFWLRRYNGPADANDIALALSIDDSTNVYVTGASSGTSSSDDYLTIKYAVNGDTVWVKRYNGQGNAIDQAVALAVDNSGYVYLTGYSDSDTSQTETNFDYATIKYTPNGDTMWVKSYDGPPALSDFAYALAADDSGNIYVTGSSPGSGTGDDYATIKYVTCSAKPGDANASGTYTLSDVIAIVNYIFNKAGCVTQPQCWLANLLCRGDWDGSTTVSLSDVIRAVNYIFNKPGGPWNALPSGVCCL